MKNILITGGAWFSGSNLCDHFITKGSKVTCLDNFATGHQHNLTQLVNHPDFVYDPWANLSEVLGEYGVESLQTIDKLIDDNYKFDAIMLGGSHDEFANLDMAQIKKENAVLYDVKGVLKGSDSKL